MSDNPTFLINAEGQVYDWTERLAAQALKRGLVPYDPDPVNKTSIEEPLVKIEDMIKTELIVYAQKQFKVFLDKRKSRANLIKEVKDLVNGAE